MKLYIFTLLGAGLAPLSAVLTWLVMRLALRWKILDHPNERSSHQRPTPHGGGLAIVISFFIGLTAGFPMMLTTPVIAMSLGLGGLLVAAVGFWDDRGHVPAGYRILVHTLAAGWLLWRLSGPPPVEMASFSLDWGWIGYIAGLVAIVWLVNIYNFMDGIDGLAGAEVLTSTVPMGWILWTAGQTDLAWCTWCLAAGTLGFLVWNRPPARIFMGDSGSGFLGFILAALTVITAHQNPAWLWTWILLLGVFEVDATVTLVRRLIRKEPWYQAHRRHAYQHAARRWGHGRVTLAVTVINMAWLLPWALVGLRWPMLAPVSLVVGLGPLVVLAFFLGAGRD